MKKYITLITVLVISMVFSAGCSEDMEIREVKDDLKPYKVKTVKLPKKYYNIIWGIDDKNIYCQEYKKGFLLDIVQISLHGSQQIKKLPVLSAFDSKPTTLARSKFYVGLVGEKKYKNDKKSYKLYKLYTDENNMPKKEILYETKIAAFPQAGLICQDKIIVNLVRKKGVDEIISIDAETGERKLINRGKYSYDSKGRVSGTCLAGNFLSSGNVEEENFCYQVMDLKKHNKNYYKTLKSGIYLYSIKSGKSRRVIEYPRIVDSLATTGDVICFTNDREEADKIDKETGELFEVYVRRGKEFKSLKLRGLENCDVYYFMFLGNDKVIASGGDEIYVIDYKKKTYFRRKVNNKQEYLGYGKREMVLLERLGNGKVRLSYYR